MVRYAHCVALLSATWPDTTLATAPGSANASSSATAIHEAASRGPIPDLRPPRWLLLLALLVLLLPALLLRRPPTRTVVRPLLLLLLLDAIAALSACSCPAMDRHVTRRSFASWPTLSVLIEPILHVPTGV